MAAREKKVDETSYEVSGSVKVLGGLTLFVLWYMFWGLTSPGPFFYINEKVFYVRLPLFVVVINFIDMILMFCLHVLFVYICLKREPPLLF